MNHITVLTIIALVAIAGIALSPSLASAKEKPEFPRTFVPAEIDLGDWEQIEPLFKKLLDAEINSVADLEQWLLDRSEVGACIGEESSRRYVQMTCKTDDTELEKRFLHMVKEIQPKLKPYYEKLDKKYYNSPYRNKLDQERYAIFDRNTAVDIELFREENIPLQTEDSLLRQKYQKLNGAMTAEFDGEEMTFPQLEVILEETDRSRREEAWTKIANRRLQDRDEMDNIYDKMVALRDTIAKNADFSDYRAYMFKSRKRFDYTPEDCLAFHDAIEKWVVPLSRKLAAQRKKSLGVDTLRPWDLGVDPQGRKPLTPFTTEDELKAGTLKILKRLNPTLAAQYADMDRRGNLDLFSRKAKAPGGYCTSFAEIRRPFIFMNSAGLLDDVNTMLHEAGHAFHVYAHRNEPLLSYRGSPIEFAEVASMSMELFTIDLLDEFFTKEEAARAKRKMIEEIIAFLPWMAQVDAFQHWVYTHPKASRDERTQAWLNIHERFDARTDWSGHEDTKDAEWHRKLHFFTVPFYYVEYGIAQLGALQLWNNFKEDPEKALNDYRSALALGNSRTLPELFKAAGANFDLSEKTVKPLMDMLEEELAKLPE